MHLHSYCSFLGITNYLFYSKHMALTGDLPPAFIVTATIAADTGGSRSDNTEDFKADNDIQSTIKHLKIKRTLCGVCGATRSTNGDPLSVCAKCQSVAYCCSEHQKLHWKQGGHKQQCNLMDKIRR